MAELIHDEPEWPMPSLTREPSLRRLRVWRVGEGALVAIITERGEGTSVTNVAREAYAAVQARYPGARVFEHYPADVGADPAEHLDEITLTREGRTVWKPWPVAVIAEWIGPNVLEQPLSS